MKNILIKTKRLILREYKRSDWLVVHSYASDTEVVKFVDWGPNSPKDTQEFIKRVIGHQKEKPRKEYELAVALKSNDQLVGGGALHVLSPKIGELGIVLNREFWGQGFGSELAQTLIKFGFSQLNLNRIIATADPRNIGSIKLQEKAGLRRGKTLPKYKYIKRENRWRDRYLYAILKSDWKRNND